MQRAKLPEQTVTKVNPMDELSFVLSVDEVDMLIESLLPFTTAAALIYPSLLGCWATISTTTILCALGFFASLATMQHLHSQ